MYVTYRPGYSGSSLKRKQVFVIPFLFIFPKSIAFKLKDLFIFSNIYEYTLYCKVCAHCTAHTHTQIVAFMYDLRYYRAFFFLLSTNYCERNEARLTYVVVALSRTFKYSWLSQLSAELSRWIEAWNIASNWINESINYYNYSCTTSYYYIKKNDIILTQLTILSIILTIHCCTFVIVYYDIACNLLLS